MKISIELEIGADELPLASELLKTLRCGFDFMSQLSFAVPGMASCVCPAISTYLVPC